MTTSTVSSLLRTTQAYCQQLCEKQTLDYGIAFYSERFATLPQMNQYREVVIENPARVPDAFDEAERAFREQGLTCCRWAPAVDQPIEAIESHLAEHGFTQRAIDVFLLTSWPEGAEDPSVRILPARAMRPALRALLPKTAQAQQNPTPDLYAEALEERMDDPQFDMFVAIHEEAPAACAALYQVGDIARVVDLHVTKEDDAVVRALMTHLLATARRLAFRTICTSVDRADTRFRRLVESLGFSHDGETVEFDRTELTG